VDESTSLTQRLGDAGAMAMVRAHDEIVRGALERHRGSEVKHTGDGLMAVFPSVVGKGFVFRSRGRLRLKGFDSPMSAFEVAWRTSGS
jgi:class 3 adenylate cyclase